MNFKVGDQVQVWKYGSWYPAKVEKLTPTRAVVTFTQKSGKTVTRTVPQTDLNFVRAGDVDAMAERRRLARQAADRAETVRAQREYRLRQERAERDRQEATDNAVFALTDPYGDRADVPDGYVVRFTTAPEAYDYGYVRRSDTGLAVFDKPLYRVVMPAESTQYQGARYESGMYVFGEDWDMVSKFGNRLTVRPKV